MQYDAVVIGAGHNGLASAIHLAKAGWKVAVVESASQAGGAVKTVEATLPGFRHDLGAMNLSLFAGSAFFREFQSDLLAHGLEFVPATRTFSSVFPDGGWLGVDQDIDKTVASISVFSEPDAARWREMATEFGSDAPHIFSILGTPMPSWALLKVLYQAWRTKGRTWCLDTLRLILSSPREFLDEHFESKEVKALMAAWGMHLDFAPDVAGGALFPYLESMASQSFGMVLGKGGAATIVRSMTSFLESLGGEIHLSATVIQVNLEANVATGVKLADGRVFNAKRAVIANLAPQALFGRLVPNAAVPSGFSRRIRSFKYGPGTMMIHLALSDLPEWRASSALKTFAYVHVAPYLSDMAQAYNDAMNGLLPASPVIVVGQPSAIDPSRAPDSQHVLWLQVRVLPGKIRGDAGGTISAMDWAGAKEAYADRVIEKLTSYAPNLPGTILDRAIYSPTDLEQDNPNLVGGDNLAGSHHLRQNFLFRPVLGWSRYRMPIEHLYMVGASTWPGAGTGAGSGQLLGKMLSQK
ncbi:MAG: dehydrogenase [Acidiferrobacteraceae bacterium]|nr:dehydrogenase [Acidiferrobacteraceae bacterium]MCP4828785.1 NAD(P)/FAD-dependent oxidoreductase [Pseudomonadota bacterium]HJP07473.1 NAD(P)/FAD-dependent oxidoreductase [Arenicellales bacterium]